MKTTRHVLFDQVWATPIVHLVKQYECTQITFKSTCIKNDIPLPPSNHWTKSYFGRGYPKPDLPNPDFNPEITIPVMSERTRKAHEQEKVIRENLAKHNQKLKPITEYTNLHPLAKSTYDLALIYEKEIKKLTKQWSWHDREKYEVNLYNDKGRFILGAADKCFPFIASNPSIFRSIKLIDPLFKALEEKGVKCVVLEDGSFYKGSKKRETVFIKEGIEIKARIREGYSRISSKAKLRENIPKFLLSDYDEPHYPNGVLYFDTCHEFSFDTWHTFKDGSRFKLEDQLPIIFNYLLDTFSEIKAKQEARRIKREREKHIFEVDEFNRIRLDSRRDQYKSALEEVKLFKEIQALNEYLNIIEHRVFSLSKEEQTVANRWIAVVRLYANLNEPLNRRIIHFKKIVSNPDGMPYEYWMLDKREY